MKIQRQSRLASVCLGLVAMSTPLLLTNVSAIAQDYTQVKTSSHLLAQGMKPTTPEKTKPTTSSETAPTTSEEMKPSTSGETVPTTSGETAPTTSEEMKPSTSGETVPTTSGEMKPTISGETAPTTSEEMKPSTSGESAPTTSGEMKPTTSGEMKPTTTGMTTGTIVEVAAANDSFKILVAAIKAAGLTETLSGKGPFTVFAPTDKAFEALPKAVVESLLKPENKDKLQKLLAYHVISGEVTSKMIKSGAVKTLEGSPVTVSVKNDKVMVGSANVISTDIDTSNGVIHVIDKVLLPPNL